MNKNIYLIYSQNLNFIKEEINKITKDKDIVKYDMLETSIKEAIDDLLTMSLFSDRKVVICNNCEFLTSNQDIEYDISSLLNIIDKKIDNELILTVDKLDERKKIVKELKSKVIVITLDNDNYFEFVSNELKDYNVKKDLVEFIIEYVGKNYDILKSEIDKLKIYKDEDKTITKEDILAICSKKNNEDIFELVEAIVKKDYDKAFLLYEDFVNNKEEIIKLLIILANQFRLIYQSKNMYQSGYTELDISKQLDVHPYRVKLAKQSNISEKEALFYLNKIADLDIKIKTNQINKNLVFELLILDI